MEKKKIIIATAVRATDPMTATVTAGWAMSLLALHEALRGADDLSVDLLPLPITYSVDSVAGRNRLVEVALHAVPDLAAILHWDDDQWPGDPAALLRQLVSTGLDIVGARYARRAEPSGWTHNYVPGEVASFLPGLEPTADRPGVHGVLNVGMGFTYTSRRWLDVMCSRSRKYRDAATGRQTADVFCSTYDELPDGTVTKRGEDYSACRAWREQGGVVGVLLTDDMGHVGPKRYTWRDVA